MNSKYIKVLLVVITLIIILGVARHIRRTTIPQPFTVRNFPAITDTSPSLPQDTAPTVKQPGGPSTEQPEKPAVVYPKVAAGDYSFSFTTTDGRLRTYRVYIPQGYDASKKYPVLFGFHGGFGTAESFEKSSNFSTLANGRGYIVVYGQGISFSAFSSAPVWNAGGCCGKAEADKENIDDVGYVRAVVEQIKLKYNIDSNRIFAAGMSNGGMLANRLACEAADVFSGAAVVSGTIQISVCAPSKKMPIVLIHGTSDENVPYYGGQGEKAVNQSTFIPVEQEFREWGNRNGCSGSIITTPVPPLASDGKTVDKLTFESCAVPVVLYRVNNGVHEWPGGGANSNSLERSSPTRVLDASKTIVDFLGMLSL